MEDPLVPVLMREQTVHMSKEEQEFKQWEQNTEAENKNKENWVSFGQKLKQTGHD
jgi:hypothetical protein